MLCREKISCLLPIPTLCHAWGPMLSWACWGGMEGAGARARSFGCVCRGEEDAGVGLTLGMPACITVHRALGKHWAEPGASSLLSPLQTWAPPAPA